MLEMPVRTIGIKGRANVPIVFPKERFFKIDVEKISTFYKTGDTILHPMFWPGNYGDINLAIPDYAIRAVGENPNDILLQKMYLADLLKIASHRAIFIAPDGRMLFWCISFKNQIIKNSKDLSFVRSFCNSEGLKIKYLEIPNMACFDQYASCILYTEDSLDWEKQEYYLGGFMRIMNSLSAS